MQKVSQQTCIILIIVAKAQHTPRHVKLEVSPILFNKANSQEHVYRIASLANLWQRHDSTWGHPNSQLSIFSYNPKHIFLGVCTG